MDDKTLGELKQALQWAITINSDPHIAMESKLGTAIAICTSWVSRIRNMQENGNNDV